MRSMNSRVEELEGSLAGSRSERERLSISWKDAETGSFIFLLGEVPPITHETDLPPSAKHQLDNRLRDALATTSDLETRLGISQQELREAQNQTSQHQQTISLLVSEKNALATSADRLAELEPRTHGCRTQEPVVSPP